MESRSAAKRWDCVVLPDVIDAADEAVARATFIQTLIDDDSLIRVSPHVEQETDVDA